LNAQEKEVTKIIEGDKKALEAVLRSISNASIKIDACVDQTRPVLRTGIKQFRFWCYGYFLGLFV